MCDSMVERLVQYKPYSNGKMSSMKNHFLLFEKKNIEISTKFANVQEKSNIFFCKKL